MKKDYSEIIVLLDRSGSMQAARTDHEGGLNSFVKEQQALPGDVRFTLIQFDSQNACEVVYDGVKIGEVGACTLNPRGSTPLLDAIGRGVAHVAERLDKAKKKPQQTLVMVITDGYENASREFKKETVKALIQERETKHGWKFLYLGANVDAFGEAGALGVNAAAAMNFANNAQGTQSMYSTVSANTLKSRHAAARGASVKEIHETHTFTDEQRKNAMGGGN